MTVREKMDEILNNDPDYLDSGEFNLDHRPHGVLQSESSSKIKVIYESKDDIDENDNPVTVEMDYDNLGEMLKDFPLTY